MNTRRNVSKLLLATTNLGKIKEFCSLFEQIPFQITTPDKEQIILDVEESGSTFSENAYIKSIAYMILRIVECVLSKHYQTKLKYR